MPDDLEKRQLPIDVTIARAWGAFTQVLRKPWYEWPSAVWDRPTQAALQEDDLVPGLALMTIPGAEEAFSAGSTMAVAYPSAPPSVWWVWESAKLQTKIQMLEARVAILEERVGKLTSQIEESEKLVVLRTISRQDAKEEILALFRGGDVLDYGLIAERLQLDLQLVVDICNELEKEGMIG